MVFCSTKLCSRNFPIYRFACFAEQAHIVGILWDSTRAQGSMMVWPGVTSPLGDGLIACTHDSIVTDA